MWRDVQYGVRQISRKKLFSAVVILLLAVGIGANTVIFSFVNALLLKPLPIRAPENLYLLQKMRVKQVRPDTSFFYRQFQALAQDKKLFSAAIAEQEWFSGNLQPFSASDSVRLVTTQIVSPNYFSELGVQALRGRVLTKRMRPPHRIFQSCSVISSGHPNSVESRALSAVRSALRSIPSLWLESYRANFMASKSSGPRMCACRFVRLPY
jgi:hypothetical protein